MNLRRVQALSTVPGTPNEAASGSQFVAKRAHIGGRGGMLVESASRLKLPTVYDLGRLWTSPDRLPVQLEMWCPASSCRAHVALEQSAEALFAAHIR